MPMSAFFKAGESLTPSPVTLKHLIIILIEYFDLFESTYRHDVSQLLKCLDNGQFLLRRCPREHNFAVSLNDRDQLLLAHLAQLAPMHNYGCRLSDKWEARNYGIIWENIGYDKIKTKK